MSCPAPIRKEAYLAPKEAAEMLRIDLSTIYRLIRKKKIAVVRIGKSIRIPAENLRAV